MAGDEGLERGQSGGDTLGLDLADGLPQVLVVGVERRFFAHPDNPPEKDQDQQGSA
jgi:hypothetical protein